MSLYKMHHTQRHYEEIVSVIHESTTTRGSGGIGIITEGTETDVRMVILPDVRVYKQDRAGGTYFVETLYGQIRKTELDKVSLEPGRTKVIWNGNTYRVMDIIDYTSKMKFKNAELRMQRKVDVI